MKFEFSLDLIITIPQPIQKQLTMSSTLTRPRVKKVVAFLWNGVWTLDRTGLPMKGVKKKFIQKNRDILPALCNDTLYLIGKEVRGIREGRDRAYHERQYRIYRGLEEMPFNCVEHGAVVLHKKVQEFMVGSYGGATLRQICNTHEDNVHRRWCQLSHREDPRRWSSRARQVGQRLAFAGGSHERLGCDSPLLVLPLDVLQLVGEACCHRARGETRGRKDLTRERQGLCWDLWGRYDRTEQYAEYVNGLMRRGFRRRGGWFYTMPDWEWAGPSYSGCCAERMEGAQECSVCGIRGHTKENCKGIFRSPPQGPGFGPIPRRLKVLGLEEGNWEWGSHEHGGPWME